MPAEVDCTDEFLARSDWRLTFHYKINGEYQRYSGKISDTKSSPRTTFVINCKDNGYVQDLTLFHSNGNIAVHFRVGLYIQIEDFWDNIEQYECYSETGQPISKESFISLYENLLYSLNDKLSRIKIADSGDTTRSSNQSSINHTSHIVNNPQIQYKSRKKDKLSISEIFFGIVVCIGFIIAGFLLFPSLHPHAIIVPVVLLVIIEMQ